MNISLGFKAHSGWTALVVLGLDRNNLTVIDRRRVELVERNELWAKQPYHAAEDLPSSEARKVVKAGITSAQRIAMREMKALIKWAAANGHEISGCGIVVGEAMPDWSVEEILAVHFRMHKAEGVLFREVLSRAGRACNLSVVEIREKGLLENARALGSPEDISRQLSGLGKSVGPPWGKDQKEATVAAMIALASSPGKTQTKEH